MLQLPLDGLLVSGVEVWEVCQVGLVACVVAPRAPRASQTSLIVCEVVWVALRAPQ